MANVTDKSAGGAGRFFIGLMMMIGGGYLFLDAIQVSHQLSWGMSLFSMGGMKLTPGLVLIPFLFGIGMVFYNPDNDMGWILMLATLVMLTLGVINSLNFHLRRMSAFELLMILGLAIGGLGLFLSGIRRMR